MIESFKIPASWSADKSLFDPGVGAGAWQLFLERFDKVKPTALQLQWSHYLEKYNISKLQNQLEQTLEKRLEEQGSSAFDTFRAIGWFSAWGQHMAKSDQASNIDKRLASKKWQNMQHNHSWSLEPLDDEQWRSDSILLRQHLEHHRRFMLWGSLVEQACLNVEQRVRMKKLEHSIVQHERLDYNAKSHALVVQGQKSAVHCVVLLLAGGWGQWERRQNGKAPMLGGLDFEREIKDGPWNSWLQENEALINTVLKKAADLIHEKTSYSNMKWDFFDGALDPILSLPNNVGDYDWKVVCPVQMLQALREQTQIVQALEEQSSVSQKVGSGVRHILMDQQICNKGRRRL